MEHELDYDQKFQIKSEDHAEMLSNDLILKQKNLKNSGLLPENILKTLSTNELMKFFYYQRLIESLQTSENTSNTALQEKNSNTNISSSPQENLQSNNIPNINTLTPNNSSTPPKNSEINSLKDNSNVYQKNHFNRSQKATNFHNNPIVCKTEPNAQEIPWFDRLDNTNSTDGSVII